MTNIHISGFESKTEEPLLRVDDLHKTYIHRRYGKKYETQALRGVSFSLFNDETVGVVGESGCGKTTLAKILIGLEEKSRGKITYDSNDLKFTPKNRKEFSFVFQDPYASLNPRMTVSAVLKEPLHLVSNEEMKQSLELEEASDLSRKELVERYINFLLVQVNLDPDIANSYSFELSGGQKQRVGIARALSTNPNLMIFDEPLSSLDVSVQASILQTLISIKERTKVSILFITHDLRVARYLTDRIIVMYKGQIMEDAPTDLLFEHPCHPYTEFLLDAIPKRPDEDASQEIKNVKVTSEKFDDEDIKKGCPYRFLCNKRQDICENQPPLAQMTDGRMVACHFPN